MQDKFGIYHANALSEYHVQQYLILVVLPYIDVNTAQVYNASHSV